MNFSNKIPIYLQIVDIFYQEILTNRWLAGERIPSVREAATEMEVNPNTMMRVYTHLQNLKIIYNKRGIGYFVEDSAKKIILEEKKKEFINNDLPIFIRNLELLDLTLDDIKNLLKGNNKPTKQ